MPEHIQEAVATSNENSRPLLYAKPQPGRRKSTTTTIPDYTLPNYTIPNYLESVYYWSYLNPRNVHWLDREWIVKLILWWQHAKLRNAAFSEIQPGHKVLQTAAVYGGFSPALAEHIGLTGKLSILDVAPVQVSITQQKLAGNSNTEVLLADAACHQIDTDTQVILSYFLLHEVPNSYKQKILDNLLSQLPIGAKLVLVDYHKPHWAHPLKPLMSLIFNALEPFAKSFWRSEIRDFAHLQADFNWQKTTFFGGMYQKVVVTRKKASNHLRDNP
jgi:ubiquinone/menaquinone biosynthesis C-methylase UbiE